MIQVATHTPTLDEGRPSIDTRLPLDIDDIKQPQPIDAALAVIELDAFEAPEKYLEETIVPEGGE